MIISIWMIGALITQLVQSDVRASTQTEMRKSHRTTRTAHSRCLTSQARHLHRYHWSYRRKRGNHNESTNRNRLTSKTPAPASPCRSELQFGTAPLRPPGDSIQVLIGQKSVGTFEVVGQAQFQFARSRPYFRRSLQPFHGLARSLQSLARLRD
jgi:hypothetical protein